MHQPRGPYRFGSLGLSGLEQESDMPHFNRSNYHGPASWLASSIHSDSPAHTSFVGSPDNITVGEEPSTSRGRRMPSPSSLPCHPRRPTFEQRSSSYSTHHHASTTNSIPRSTRRSETPLSSHAQHQWSLFGHIMEDERQFRSSAAIPIGPRRPSSDQSSHISQVSSIFRSQTDGSASDIFATRLLTHPHVQDVYAEQEQESTAHEEGSSEDSEETTIAATRVSGTAITRWIPSRVPTIPLLWKNMFKCSVAYFLGSLFTFHPSLSRFFGDLASNGSGAGGPYPSAHLIATM